MSRFRLCDNQAAAEHNSLIPSSHYTGDIFQSFSFREYGIENCFNAVVVLFGLVNLYRHAAYGDYNDTETVPKTVALDVSQNELGK